LRVLGLVRVVALDDRLIASIRDDLIGLAGVPEGAIVVLAEAALPIRTGGLVPDPLEGLAEGLLKGSGVASLVIPVEPVTDPRRKWVSVDDALGSWL